MHETRSRAKSESVLAMLGQCPRLSALYNALSTTKEVRRCAAWSCCTCAVTT
jgi:hypothetical protein